MKNIALLIVLILAAGCYKIDDNLEFGPVCSNCIYGNWELTYRVFVIDDDTVSLFENGVLTEFWSGDIGSRCNSYLKLQILDDNFIFTSFKEGYDSGEDELTSYEENWKWMNSSILKTHLKIPLEIREGWITTIYKIKKLTDDELSLESYTSGFGSTYYELLEFNKVNSSIDINANYEHRAIQEPSNILGSWKLDEFRYKTNDSIFSVYINDTLTIQDYDDLVWPHKKVIKKHYYELTMTFKEFGDFTAHQQKDGTTSDMLRYWYWNDEINPHVNLFFTSYLEYSISPVIMPTGYRIKSLNKKFLELEAYGEYNNVPNTTTLWYKYKRIN